MNTEHAVETKTRYTLTYHTVADGERVDTVLSTFDTVEDAQAAGEAYLDARNMRTVSPYEGWRLCFDGRGRSWYVYGAVGADVTIKPQDDAPQRTPQPDDAVVIIRDGMRFTGKIKSVLSKCVIVHWHHDILLIANSTVSLMKTNTLVYDEVWQEWKEIEG